MSDSDHILVSIDCITYNQSRFVRQCLDGFLIQRADFAFEVLVYDDASTDGTADIIREYAKQYPRLFKPIYETENQYSKGANISLRYQYPRAIGKYIAACEGDDYWTDPLKLQRQVDFLEGNPDFAICFHKVRVWKQQEQKMVDDFITREVSSETDIYELAKGNYIHTPSVMYRRNRSVYNDMLTFSGLPVGDYVAHMLNAQYGEIKCLEDCMAVYRHGAGVWSALTNVDRYKKWVLVLQQLRTYFQNRNRNVFDILGEQYLHCLSGLLVSYLQQNNNERSKYIYDLIINADCNRANINNVIYRVLESSYIKCSPPRFSRIYRLWRLVPEPLKMLCRALKR